MPKRVWREAVREWRDIPTRILRGVQIVALASIIAVTAWVTNCALTSPTPDFSVQHFSVDNTLPDYSGPALHLSDTVRFHLRVCNNTSHDLNVSLRFLAVHTDASDNEPKLQSIDAKATLFPPGCPDFYVTEPLKSVQVDFVPGSWSLTGTFHITAVGGTNTPDVVLPPIDVTVVP